MKVHYDLQQLPIFHKAVITIGTFDGVHKGHQAIIHQLKKEAEKIGGETVIVTFHPHPRMVVGGQAKPLQLLNTLPEKIELLGQQGINHLVVVPFTQIFSEQSAEDYIKDFLVKTFHPNTIIIGYDHRFGKGRLGDFQLLELYSKQLNFNIQEIPVQVLNEVAINSTKIRNAINNSQIEEANKNLGYTYFFEADVIKGNQLGRTIGYPTANLQLNNSDKLLPGKGVYAVKAKWAVGSRLSAMNDSLSTSPLTKGMMNIGTRPTVDGTNLTVEVNLFDFNADIYGQTLRVYVHAHLRSEQKFNGLDALKDQLAIDKNKAIRILSIK